jgi:hypothetical protein
VAVSYDLDDSVEVLFGQLGSGWQTEPAIEEIFAHTPPYNTAALKYGLGGHGLPDGLGAGVFRHGLKKSISKKLII